MSFILAFGSAVLLTPVAAWVGLRLGVVDRPSEDPLKIHRAPTSLLGGVAVVISALGVASAIDGPPPGAVLAAVAVALLAGLVDDVRPVGPGARLLLQAAAGVVLVMGGLRVEALGGLGAAGVILLVLACSNGVNLLDGQNGLAGGLAALASLGLVALGVLEGTSSATLGLALAGALIGFLPWNLASAPVFLGNGGAYAVGTLLAILAVNTTSGAGWSALLGAGLCLGVFAFELTFTVARRVLARRPLLPGDRLHSYDLLAARLGERKRSTILLWVVGGILAGLPSVIEPLPIAVEASVTAAAWIAAMVFGFLLYSRLAGRTHP